MGEKEGTIAVSDGNRRMEIPSEGISFEGLRPPNPRKKSRRERGFSTLSLDFKPEVLEEMKARAEQEGLKLRSWARKVLLEALGKDPSINPKEVMEAYRVLAGQVARVGNNINQIARWCNKARAVDRDVLEVLEKMDQRLARILEAVAP